MPKPKSCPKFLTDDYVINVAYKNDIDVIECGSSHFKLKHRKTGKVAVGVHPHGGKKTMSEGVSKQVRNWFKELGILLSLAVGILVILYQLFCGGEL